MRWVVLVTLCACGRIDFDATADGGVIPDADRRLYGGFANPVDHGFGPMVDPQLSADGTEMWAVLFTTDLSPGDFNLHVSTLVGGTFSPMTAELTLSSVADDVEPALSRDGLVLMFLSERDNNVRQLYQATRANASQPWSAPTLVFTVSPRDVGSFDLLPDGKTIYYELDFSSGDYWKASRASVGEMFVTTEHVGTFDLNFVTIAPDERLLFGNEVPFVDGGTRWGWRASTEDAWTIEPDIVTLPDCDPVLAVDPDISPDGTHLVVHCPQLLVYTR